MKLFRYLGAVLDAALTEALKPATKRLKKKRPTSITTTTKKRRRKRRKAPQGMGFGAKRGQRINGHLVRGTGGKFTRG